MDLYNASTVLEEDEPMVLTLEDYEDAKKSLETIVARADKARRLSEHPDFKDLIMQGYLVDEPQRLAELMASGRINNQATLDGCAKELDSIGRFRNFMKLHIEQGNLAKDELVALEEARDEAIAAEEEAASAGA